jgi:hypothetical protein
MFNLKLFSLLLLFVVLASASQRTITVVYITTEVTPIFCHDACLEMQPYLTRVSSIAVLI